MPENRVSENKMPESKTTENKMPERRASDKTGANSPERKASDKAGANPPARRFRRLISKITANFFFRLFGSFLLAIFVWLTVNTTYINPPDTKTLNNVPLAQLHRNALESRNLELRSDALKSYISVELKGRKDDLDKISTSDFEAYIDFDDINGVEDTSLAVILNALNADNVTIVNVDPQEISIELENRKTKTFEISVQQKGEPADGFFLTGYTRFPSTKSFTARESLIDQIDRVEVEVDLTGLAGNAVAHQQCRIYNKDGREMNRYGWEQVIDVNLEISKIVPIITKITGSPAEDYYVQYASATPETAMINGTKEALEQVDCLYTDTLDISFMRQSVSQERALLMPGNIKMTQDKLPRTVIDVTIFRYQYTQEVALSKARIELMNNQPEYRYEVVENEIPLLLKGRADDVANVDSSHVSAVADVEGLTPGTHAVKAILTLPDGIVSVNDVLLTLIVARN